MNPGRDQMVAPVLVSSANVPCRCESTKSATRPAAPLARTPLGVPSVCVHGRADDVVPIRQSERFVAAARAVGDTSALRAFDGGHFDLIAVGSPAWSLCVAALTDLKTDLETTMEHIFEIYIRCSPERLWRAITDPDTASTRVKTASPEDDHQPPEKTGSVVVVW